MEGGTTQGLATEAVPKEPQERETFVATRQIEGRGYMGNLFEAYSNDEDRYSGFMSDNFDGRFRLLLKEAINPTSQRMIAIVHLLLCLPGMLASISSIAYRPRIWTLRQF